METEVFDIVGGFVPLVFLLDASVFLRRSTSPLDLRLLFFWSLPPWSNISAAPIATVCRIFRVLFDGVFI